MRVIVIILIFLGGINLPLSAQNSLQVEVSSSSIALDEAVQVNFVLNNGLIQSWKAPDLSDFQIQSGPNKSVSMQAINGDFTQQTSIGYVLRPLKTGRLRISSATAITSKGKFTSKPIEIEVSEKALVQENTAPTSGTRKAIFIRASTNLDKIYEGQQAIINIDLFTKVNVTNISQMPLPSIQGAFIKPLEKDYPAAETEINGQRYIRKTIMKLAVFPQKAGTIELPSMKYEVLYEKTGSDDPFSSLFGSNESLKTLVSTNELKISVLEVPPIEGPDKPYQCHSVGNFTASVSLNNAEIGLQSAASLLIKIEGDGDMKRLAAPTLEASNGGKVQAAKLVDESWIAGNGKWVGSRTYEYVIIPAQKGTITVTGKVIGFDVVGAKNKLLASVNETIIVSATGKGIVEEAQEDNGPKTEFWLDGLRKFAGILSGIIIAGFIIWLWRSRKSKPSDLKSPAKAVVKKPLEKAIVKSEKIDFEQSFHEKTDRIFYKEAYDYADHLLSQMSGMNQGDRIEKLTALQKQNINIEIIHAINEVLINSEMAMYGGLDSELIKAKILDAVRIIKQNY